MHPDCDEDHGIKGVFQLMGDVEIGQGGWEKVIGNLRESHPDDVDKLTGSQGSDPVGSRKRYPPYNRNLFDSDVTLFRFDGK